MFRGGILEVCSCTIMHITLYTIVIFLSKLFLNSFAAMTRPLTVISVLGIIECSPMTLKMFKELLLLLLLFFFSKCLTLWTGHALRHKFMWIKTPSSIAVPYVCEFHNNKWNQHYLWIKSEVVTTATKRVSNIKGCSRHFLTASSCCYVSRVTSPT